jgi:hypothetical protein
MDLFHQTLIYFLICKGIYNLPNFTQRKVRVFHPADEFQPLEMVQGVIGVFALDNRLG